MPYKYETHLHTAEASACAVSKGADYIKPYIDAGYSGLFVTDHFFGGNTTIDRSLPWRDKIEQYCRGYENTLNEATKYPQFKVFFGIEQTFDGDDYLIYGPDKKWLLSHPEIETMTHEDLFDYANDLGWLVVQAHPFRQRHYIQAIHIHFRHIHAIETYNAANQQIENDLAAAFAAAYHFPTTSGSDIHDVSDIVSASGMTFDTPLKNVKDYIRRIRSKKISD